MADILAPEIVSELGEGPIWSDGRLYWFDILGKRLFSAPPDGAVPGSSTSISPLRDASPAG